MSLCRDVSIASLLPGEPSLPTQDQDRIEETKTTPNVSARPRLEHCANLHCTWKIHKFQLSMTSWNRTDSWANPPITRLPGSTHPFDHQKLDDGALYDRTFFKRSGMFGAGAGANRADACNLSKDGNQAPLFCIMNEMGPTPKSYKEVQESMQCDVWEDTMASGIQGLKVAKTCTPCDQPPGRKAIISPRWALKWKSS